MNRLTHKTENLQLRKKRIRATVIGTSERPRLTVTISNRHITAQIIDDSKHITLVYVSTVGKKSVNGTLSEQAANIGEEIATKAKAAMIMKIVLDRNGKLYHGRIKALADAARKSGLEF